MPDFLLKSTACQKCTINQEHTDQRNYMCPIPIWLKPRFLPIEITTFFNQVTIPSLSSLFKCFFKHLWRICSRVWTKEWRLHSYSQSPVTYLLNPYILYSCNIMISKPRGYSLFRYIRFITTLFCFGSCSLRNTDRLYFTVSLIVKVLTYFILCELFFMTFNCPTLLYYVCVSINCDMLKDAIEMSRNGLRRWLGGIFATCEEL